MPFSTDTTWPAGLRKIFDVCRQEPHPLENHYYGPYIKLLTYCFGDSFDFVVDPQVPPGEFSNYGPCNVTDFVIFLVVFDARRRPVLVADIKQDGWVNRPNLRIKADDLTRLRFDQMNALCPLPRLWGLSLLGTSLRVYVNHVASLEIEPHYIYRPGPDCILPRNSLEGCWIDIFSQEGFTKMKEIVEDIIDNATALEKV